MATSPMSTTLVRHVAMEVATRQAAQMHRHATTTLTPLWMTVLVSNWTRVAFAEATAALVPGQAPLSMWMCHASQMILTTCS